MTRTLKLTAVLAAFGLCSCATVPVHEAPKLSLAREIVSLTLTSEDQLSMMAGSISATRGVADIAKTFCNPPSLSMPVEECLHRYNALEEAKVSETAELMQSIWPTLMEDWASLLAQTYTDRELAALRDFYSSPVGLSITTKQVQLDAELRRAMMARVGPQLESLSKQWSDRRMELLREVVAAGPRLPRP